MATTIASDIREEVKDRASLEGTVYDATIDRKIALACEEICLVKLSVLYVPDYGGIILTPAVTKYELPANFGQMDEDNVYIVVGATQPSVIPGNIKDIHFSPSLTAGVPRMFCCSGMNTALSARNIYIGCLTADIEYPFLFGYWRRNGTFLTTAVPFIVSVHNSAPVVAFTSYLLNKELGLLSSAQDDYLEFLGLMRGMEEYYGYSGKSYDEIVQLKEQYAKYSGQTK